MHAKPSYALSLMLSLVLFIILVAAYLFFSSARNRENPDEKLMPTPTKMFTSFKKVAFEADVKTGKVIFWNDTFVSLRRLFIGATIACTIALMIGMNVALFEGMNALLLNFLRFWNMIPPPVLLPVLFIVFGVEEVSKIVLIVISMAPAMTLAMYTSVSKIAGSQIIRSFTLGASQLEIVYRIVLPQALPHLIEILRTSLGIAWYSLILAEALAASSGIGYRIFLVRRYLAMDVIIPYALWVVVLGYAMNFVLGQILARGFSWHGKQEKS